MQSNDLPTLYAACIERDDKLTGEFVDDGDKRIFQFAYKNPDARERLADAAGACCKMKWCHAGWAPNGPAMWCYGDHTTQTTESEQWNLHGRLAPLVSLDALQAIKMPDGSFLHQCVADYEKPTFKITCYHAFGGAWQREFFYADPADRATAECAARVYACLKAKEDAHV